MEKDRPDEPAQAKIVRERVEEEANRRVSLIGNEFAKGFDVIRDYPKSVTFFGSSRLSESHPYYKKAQEVAHRLSDDGFTVVTGGGPGIMEAANRGAFEAGGDSLGFSIELPFEQVINKYVTKSLSFNYFFSRKVMLAFSAEAYIYFPGGFGTLDEFFEIVTLVQTQKIPRVPIILVGDEFWGALDDFIHNMLVNKYQTIGPEDEELYTMTEDIDEISKIVKNAPKRKE
ncbi:MAG: TIGR00730 family Rossman fold protein [Candidatus Campbellbacteria bacterium]|nr:TIGR00730 family Rossman fold protein [Candidatus Campbellbacteria bacterium]